MIAVASWLVLSSKIFYFWDNRHYQQITFDAWQAAEEGFKAWRRHIRATLVDDYNALFTLPLTPAMALFGPSRLVFILSIALLYFFPLALLCGLIGRELCRNRPTMLVLLITLIVITLAAPWQALVLGYPDFAAALTLSGAIYLYLRDRALKRLSALFVIAGLIALTILLRRHFAYAGLAFIIAAGLVCLAIRWHQQGLAQAVFNTGWRIGLLGLATVAVMFLIAPDFTRRALVENYREMYSAYWQPLNLVFAFFHDRLGLLGPILALAGYLYTWRRHLLDSAGLAFIALLGGFWLLLWLTLVRQNGPQYMLHLFPLLLGVGQGLLVYTLWQGRRWQHALAVGIVGLIGFSCANTFWLYNRTPATLQAVFPDPVLPLTDHALDYAQYQRLLNTLQTRLQHRERLYLAVSHGAMNRDVLLSAEEQLYGTHKLQQQLLLTPDVDSRDWLPLHELLQADFIAITVPFIPHLPAREQDIVRVVMQAFVEDWPFSRDFKQVEQFSFQAVNGFQLLLYQRLQPTPLTTALDTFWRMRTQVEPTGWWQQPWLNLRADQGWQVSGRVGEVNRLLSTANAAESRLLAYYPAVSGTLNLQARIQASGCEQHRLELITWQPTFFATRHSLPLHASVQQDWSVQFEQPDSAILVLALLPENALSTTDKPATEISTTGPCHIDLSAVRVSNH